MLCHMGSHTAYIALGPHSIGAGGYCIVATGAFPYTQTTSGRLTTYGCREKQPSYGSQYSHLFLWQPCLVMTYFATFPGTESSSFL